MKYVNLTHFEPTEELSLGLQLVQVTHKDIFVDVMGLQILLKHNNPFFEEGLNQMSCLGHLGFLPPFELQLSLKVVYN